MKPTSDRSESQAGSPDLAREAEEAFSDYLRMVDEGSDVDFDAYCAERPDLSEALRALQADWDRMAGMVDDLGSSFPGDGAPPTEPGLGSLESGGSTGNGNRLPRTPSDMSATFELDVEGRGPAPAGRPGSNPVANVIERLSSGSGGTRYSPRGEIARGGMGVVLRMWDSDLRRNLAMKVMLDRRRRKTMQDSTTETRQIGRFLEEAQITGQLDHPGIVPVHELGLNDAGQLYFTMRLVRGRDLRTIFELVHDELEDWTVARALGVIQRVCEAMAYAHSKRVIHRDIKPSNIMVGRFGEVYVMDWGLAKVMGRKDMHDLRPAVDSAESIRTERHATYIDLDETHDGEIDSEDGDSPLQTMDGTVVGTPSYMSPEQAGGEDDLIGPCSDIYSVGALLYQLLTGQMPYVEPGKRISPFAVLSAVREGPPMPIHQINRKVPPELVAICERAMARSIDDRYPSMEAMADELRAFLEGRVVRTYEAGALAEARKWVVRNKGTAAILAVALMALTVLLVNLIQTNEQLTAKSDLALKSENRAKEASAEMQSKADELAVKNVELVESRKTALESAALAKGQTYVATIAAADAGLRFYEAERARQSLSEAPQEFRKWEWDHLKLKSDPSLQNYGPHQGKVTDVAFSPQGTLLASSSWDGLVRIWRLNDRPLKPIDLKGVAIESIAFHINGRTLACGDVRGRVTLWNAEDAKQTGEFWVDPERAEGTVRISSLVFSPNGKRLFAGTDTRQIVSWNVDNEERRILPTLHRRAINSIDISPDGRYLVSGSNDQSAALWDVQTSEQIFYLVHEDAVLGVAFSPDGRSVATACADGQVRVFETADGKLSALLEGHTAAVNSVRFSPLGDRLVTSSDDGTVRRWDIASGEQFSALNGHEGPVLSAVFSPDGIHMASSGSTDSTVRLWDRAYDGATTWLEGHTDQITSMAVSPDGRRIISGALDNQLRIWDSDALVSLASQDTSVGGASVVAFSPDNDQVAAAVSGRGPNHAITFWDASDRDMLVPLDVVGVGHTDQINAIEYSPDGKLLATASQDHTARVWDVATGEQLFALRHESPVLSLAFDRENGLLATGSFSDTIRIYDLEDGVDIHTLTDTEGAVHALAWSPDGLLTSAHGPKVCIRLANYDVRHMLEGHQDDITDLSYHPTAGRLATASRDATIVIWDTESGTKLLGLRSEDECPDLQFSPGGERLYAAVGARIQVFEAQGPGTNSHARRGPRIAANEARELFQEMLGEHVVPAGVIAALEADESLDTGVKREAIRLARNFGTNPIRLAETAWSQLKDPDPALHAEALLLARAANNMLPGNSRLMSVLGAANYRHGDYESAIISLQRAQELRTAEDDYPEAWNLLYMAMAHQQQGSGALARAHYNAAREREAGGPTDATLELEARTLLGL